MSSNWREIDALAAALLARETLSWEDAIEVISPGSKALRVALERANAVATAKRKAELEQKRGASVHA